MRWRLLLSWLLLLVLGGASAMLFWASFNRIVGGFGSRSDWVRGAVGIAGVVVVLVLARWVLARTGALGEVGGEETESTGAVGEGTERSGEHVGSATQR